jgi:hypothetical protein
MMKQDILIKLLIASTFTPLPPDFCRIKTSSSYTLHSHLISLRKFSFLAASFGTFKQQKLISLRYDEGSVDDNNPEMYDFQSFHIECKIL